MNLVHKTYHFLHNCMIDRGKEGKGLKKEDGSKRGIFNASSAILDDLPGLLHAIYTSRSILVEGRIHFVLSRWSWCNSCVDRSHKLRRCSYHSQCILMARNIGALFTDAYSNLIPRRLAEFSDERAKIIGSDTYAPRSNNCTSVPV